MATEWDKLFNAFFFYLKGYIYIQQQQQQQWPVVYLVNNARGPWHSKILDVIVYTSVQKIYEKSVNATQ